MKPISLILLSALLVGARWCGSLSHVPVKLKVFDDLTLQSRDAYKQFEFEDSQWEFGVIPRLGSDECYVRLSYWFNREALLLFELDEQGGQGHTSEFVLYVGPEHPLKLLDWRVAEEGLKQSICADKEFFQTGIDSALQFLSQRLAQPGQLERLIGQSLSSNSLSIAAPLEDFRRIYQAVWDNEDFYDQKLMDRMMWKNDGFAAERYSESYLQSLSSSVSKTLANDFKQFLDQKQTGPAQDKLGQSVGDSPVAYSAGRAAD